MFLFTTLLSICLKHHSGLSILSWNVNGLRSLIKHDNAIRSSISSKLEENQMATSATNIFNRLIQKRNVDILCLQETKLQEQHVAELDRYLRSVLDIHSIYWSCSTIKKGYSGTAIILLNTKYNQEIYNSINTEVKVSYNLDDDEVMNDEGRIITLECDKYSLINTYVPNSGDQLVRLPYRIDNWDQKLSSHIIRLKRKRPNVPVILVGDLNVAHTHLDYYNSRDKYTHYQPGLTPQEQSSFSDKIIEACGMIDTFRFQYPTLQKYSYFSARLKDEGRRRRMGYRIDYVLLSAPCLSSSSSSIVSSPSAATSVVSSTSALSISSSSSDQEQKIVSTLVTTQSEQHTTSLQSTLTIVHPTFDAYIEEEV